MVNIIANDIGFGSDVCLPFQMERVSARGRIVRMERTLQDVIKPHALPQQAARLMADAMVSCALTASLFKFDGTFILQASGNGPVTMLVSDMTAQGGMRGVLHYDDAQLQDMDAQSGLSDFMGDGHMAFTIEQGPSRERYQGIVELRGQSFSDGLNHYFEQSEQIRTKTRVFIDVTGDKIRATGLLIQEMPDIGGYEAGNVEKLSAHRFRDKPPVTALADDDWQRLSMFLDTATDREIMDPALGLEDLLIRFFHEDGIRVYDKIMLYKDCRCSQEKIDGIGASLGAEELDDLKNENGDIVFTCEFCNKEFVLNTSPREGMTE